MIRWFKVNSRDELWHRGRRVGAVEHDESGWRWFVTAPVGYQDARGRGDGYHTRGAALTAARDHWAATWELRQRIDHAHRDVKVVSIPMGGKPRG